MVLMRPNQSLFGWSETFIDVKIALIVAPLPAGSCLDGTPHN